MTTAGYPGEPVAIRALVDFLGGDIQVRGSVDGALTGVGALDSAEATHLAFCDGDGAASIDAIRASRAGAVLITRAAARHVPAGDARDRPLLACDAPRLDLVRAVDRFWPEPAVRECRGADAGARVHASCEVAADAWVDPTAVVGPGCSIGAASSIHPGVCLYRGTRLGKRVRVDANAVIGAPGFGFAQGPDGRWHRFPQRGVVWIDDDVEIGAGACIDRGALGDTRIGRGTKIDNLAYVAHNVRIGRDCLVMASTVVAGSCVLEDGVVISPGANIRDHCRIGRGAHVGTGAVVVADVAAGTTVAGVPAVPMNRRREKD